MNQSETPLLDALTAAGMTIPDAANPSLETFRVVNT
jgi:hypothetical protein